LKEKSNKIYQNKEILKHRVTNFRFVLKFDTKKKETDPALDPDLDPEPEI